MGNVGREVKGLRGAPHKTGIDILRPKFPHRSTDALSLQSSSVLNHTNDEDVLAASGVKPLLSPESVTTKSIAGRNIECCLRLLTAAVK